MTDRKKVFILRLINTLFFIVLIAFQYNGVFSIKIQAANPMLPLALLVSISIFSSELTTAISGLIVGIFIDSVSSTVPGFHAIVFLILGLSASLIVKHLFNNNIFSACALCLICGVFYYLLRWIFCYAFMLSLTENLTYLMRTALPSAIYTAIFIIPFYYLEKFLYNKFYHL